MKKCNIKSTANLSLRNVIYKLVFPNGKIYIGQTTLKLRDRLRLHIFEANKSDSNRPIYNAIRKYKEFEVFILDVANTVEELNEKETKYIRDLNSIIDNKKGYNSDYGGNNREQSELLKQKSGRIKGFTISEEQKRIISEANKGRTFVAASPEANARKIKALTGRVLSQETKDKMAKAKLGRKLTQEQKDKISQSRLNNIVKTENL